MSGTKKQKVRIKPLSERFIMPARVTEGSAAYDLAINEEYVLKSGRQLIKLGFSMEIPTNMYVDIRPRSGYSLKGLKAYDQHGAEVRIDADVVLGTIDSDYRGEVGVILVVRDRRVEMGMGTYHINAGDAVAQMCYHELPNTCLELSEELTDTERGEKGFGKANNE